MSNKKHSLLVIFTLITLLSSVFVFFIALHPITTTAEKEKELDVLVITNGSYDKFLESIEIDPSLDIKTSKKESKLNDLDDSIDVVVLLDPKVFPWPSFIAPGIAAIITYFCLRFTSLLIWSIPLGDKISNVFIIFCVGVFGFLYFFAFLVGFFGGFDDNTLKELERASKMIGGIGVFTKALYRATKIGCKLSPGLHNRFPVKIFKSAMDEAYSLTLEKKKLEI